jgi:gamma-glutamyltranspeptidase / glutathione hydrolase
MAANGIIAAIQAANGTMTLQDLSGYTVLVREPIQIDYHGYKLYSTGIPSSGAVTLSTLRIIECYDMSNKTLLNLNTHRLDEAIRFAYGMHNELGDPDFSEGMSVFEAEMLKPSTAARIRSRISDCHTKNVSEYNPEGLSTPETHGTSHIVTADASGLSISLTSTINLLFGSKLIVPDSGYFRLPFFLLVAG